MKFVLSKLEKSLFRIMLLICW